MKKQRGKRMLSAVLVLCMVLMMAPIALADSDSALAEANAANNMDYTYSTRKNQQTDGNGYVTLSFNVPDTGRSSIDYYAAVIPSDSTSASDVEYVRLAQSGSTLSSTYIGKANTNYDAMLVQPLPEGGDLTIATDKTSVAHINGESSDETIKVTATFKMSSTLANIVVKALNSENNNLSNNEDLTFTAHLKFTKDVKVSTSISDYTFTSSIFELESVTASGDNGVDIECKLKDGLTASNVSASSLRSENMTLTGDATIGGATIDSLVKSGAGSIYAQGWCAVNNIPSFAYEEIGLAGTIIVPSEAVSVAIEVKDELTVEVVDSSGDAIDGALVTVTPLGASSGEKQETNSDGIAVFGEMTYGVYKVVVTYGTHTKTDTFSFTNEEKTTDAIELDTSEETVTVTTTVNSHEDESDSTTVTASASGLEEAVNTSTVTDTTVTTSDGEETTVADAIIAAVVEENDDVSDEDNISSSDVTVTDISIDLTAATVDADTGDSNSSTSSEDTLAAIEDIGTTATADSDIETVISGSSIESGTTVADGTLALTDILDVAVELTTTATVSTSSGDKTTTVTTSLSTTNKLINTYFKISDLLAGLIKSNNISLSDIRGYRYHGTSAEKLKEVSQTGEDEGYFTLSSTDTNGDPVYYIGIRAKNYSIYAFGVVLDDESVIPDVTTESNTSNKGSSSSGSSSKTVTVASASNGSVRVSSTSVSAGSTVTITVTPDEGYKLNTLTVTDANGNAIAVTANANGTYSFTMPSTAVTVTATFSVELADTATTGVGEMLDTETQSPYMHGYEDATFRPNGSATRAEVAQVFYNLLLDKDVEITTSFTDVAEDAWYAEAVNTLASLGIVNGSDGEHFNPEDNITRAEFVAIAARFANETEITVTFSDVPETHWAYTYVGIAASYGWVTGESEDVFAPERDITRAEIATIVNRILGWVPNEAAIDAGTGADFSDVDSTHWAWYQITVATSADAAYITTDSEEA